MNAIAALLIRAQAQVFEGPPTLEDLFPAGAWVERTLPGVDPIFGCVTFVDDGWIHWTATDGSSRASRVSALRRWR